MKYVANKISNNIRFPIKKDSILPYKVKRRLNVASIIFYNIRNKVRITLKNEICSS